MVFTPMRMQVEHCCFVEGSAFYEVHRGHPHQYVLSKEVSCDVITLRGQNNCSSSICFVYFVLILLSFYSYKIWFHHMVDYNKSIN
jgi:hypothetical protein